MPADLEETVRKSACRNGGQVFLPAANLPEKMGDISADRFTDCQLICQQIWRHWGNLPAKMGVFFWRQIYWLSANVPADLETFRKSAGRNRGRGYFCWKICRYWLSVILPADLDSQEIFWWEIGGYFCRQIYLVSVNLPAELKETVRKSSGRSGGYRFTDCQLICQPNWGVFLLADLLTVS